MTDSVEKPCGDLAIRVLAMPKDVNHNGDIFGGWVLAHMDMAAVSCATEKSGSRVTTAAVDGMSFIAPIHVGDFVCIYAKILSTGRSSMVVLVETWATNGTGGPDKKRRKVTEGRFTCVAIDDHGKPHAVFGD